MTVNERINKLKHLNKLLQQAIKNENYTVAKEILKEIMQLRIYEEDEHE